MASPLRLSPALFFLLLCGPLLAGCKVVSMDTPSVTSEECGGCDGDAISPSTELTASSATDTATTTDNALTLCGFGSCLPDDRAACTGSNSPAPPRMTSGESGPADAGPALDAGTQADGGLFSAANADASTAMTPSVDSDFMPTAKPEAEALAYSCQIAASEDPSSVTRQCGQAGSQDIGEACSSVSDCAPGLGCVGTASNARCLPYCCALISPCGENAYCTHRPLYDDSSAETPNPPLIPVCEPVDSCSLNEPFPCPPGQDCSCGPEEACAVVRSDGATSCTRPSPTGSAEGGGCPCLAGFICSQSSDGGICRKLCSLDEESPGSCGSGLCQSSGGLPTGWGTCVGSSVETP